ncbi:MAG: nitric oxide reductase activation protein NorD [Methanosarcina sp.]
MLDKLKNEKRFQEKSSQKEALNRDQFQEKGLYKELSRQNLSKKTLFELIISKFQKLEKSELSKAVEEFSGFNEAEIQFILHLGIEMAKQGKRVQAAYIATAPAVYKLLSQQEFEKWLELSKQTSKLSFSCLEGFFNFSSLIIKKKDLALLEKWTELGISLAQKSSTFGIAYFNHTAEILTSGVFPEKGVQNNLFTGSKTSNANDLNLVTNLTINSNSTHHNLNKTIFSSPDIFPCTAFKCLSVDSNDSNSAETCCFPQIKTLTAAGSPSKKSCPVSDVEEELAVCFKHFEVLIKIGEHFAASNQKVAEIYFKQVPVMLSVFSSVENFGIFCNIIDRLVGIEWTTAIEILNGTEEAFSTLSSEEQKSLLVQINELLNYGTAPALALYKNASSVMTKLEGREFKFWILIARRIAEIEPRAAVAFFNYSPNLLLLLSISELKEWADKAIIRLSAEKRAFERFFESSFKGLEKPFKTLDKEERLYLLDIGVELALINPDCLDNYFEYAPDALRLFSGPKFKKWIEIGTGILKESPNFGSTYFKASILAFKKIHPSYFEEILKLGTLLLEKDWLLAGKFFENLPDVVEKIDGPAIKKWADTGIKVYDKDRYLSVDYFSHSSELLPELDISELEEWALNGLRIFQTNPSLGRPYFSLKSKSSRDFIEELTGGAALKNVEKILKYYAIGLSGTNFKIRSKKELPISNKIEMVNPVIAGKTIYLEPKLKKCEKFEDNFKIYKLSVMHEVGHHQFSSSKIPPGKLHVLLNDLVGEQKKDANSNRESLKNKINTRLSEQIKLLERADNTDKGISDPQIAVIAQTALRADVEHNTNNIHQNHNNTNYNNCKNYNNCSNCNNTFITTTNITATNNNSSNFCNYNMHDIDADISDLIAVFPNSTLAASILGILEDARVEFLIMVSYRGVRLDLEKIRSQILLEREVPEGELEKLIEALLWFSTLHEPDFELNSKYKILFDKIQKSLQSFIFQPASSTLNSLLATFIIYTLFEDFLGPLDNRKSLVFKNLEYRGVGLGSLGIVDPNQQNSHENVIKKFIPEPEETENAASPEKNTLNKLPDKLPEELPEKKNSGEKPGCAASKNWKVLGKYSYDEWDYAIDDYKSDWCTLKEIEPVGESNANYTEASDRYRNEILLIKNIFSRMKPETFHKLKGQTDGTEIDIDAFSEALIERKCGISPEEKFYIKWDKRKRDVATLFLVDVSVSTKKKLGRRSILDVERDALVIMIQALESIGDRYAIYAFSGHTREDVEYYVIKEFDEEMSRKVEERISVLEPVANTRLGPAVRHSIKKLDEVKADTKILILLSDGEPYDTCYGEGAYQGKLAEEDTKTAIQEGNAHGIHFFCITVDNSQGSYLDRIFSDSEYTIIDDVQILPERLPLLYKRITT